MSSFVKEGTTWTMRRDPLSSWLSLPTGRPLVPASWTCGRAASMHRRGSIDTAAEKSLYRPWGLETVTGAGGPAPHAW